MQNGMKSYFTKIRKKIKGKLTPVTLCASLIDLKLSIQMSTCKRQ